MLKYADVLIIRLQDVKTLLTDYEHSIAKAKIAAFEKPPSGRVLTSRDEARCVVPVRDSFTTVQELRRRAVRLDSILNHSGFLLVDEPKTMGMPSREVLDKFKNGLRDALFLMDRLSDLETDSSLGRIDDGQRESQQTSTSPADTTTTTTTTNSPAHLTTDDAEILAYNARIALQFRQLARLRDLQMAALRAQPTRALAWLLTLTAGAARGYVRYCESLLRHDPAMATHRVLAFKELLLRKGLFFLWGFVRGTGSLGAFVRAAVWQVAEEVLFFEQDFVVGGESMPRGLHMTIVGELRARVVEERRAKEGRVVGEDEVEIREVFERVNGIVAAEIGWEGWKGYDAVAHPVIQD